MFTTLGGVFLKVEGNIHVHFASRLPCRPSVVPRRLYGRGNGLSLGNVELRGSAGRTLSAAGGPARSDQTGTAPPGGCLRDPAQGWNCRGRYASASALLRARRW